MLFRNFFLGHLPADQVRVVEGRNGRSGYQTVYARKQNAIPAGAAGKLQADLGTPSVTALNHHGLLRNGTVVPDGNRRAALCELVRK